VITAGLVFQDAWDKFWRHAGVLLLCEVTCLVIFVLAMLAVVALYAVMTTLIQHAAADLIASGVIALLIAPVYVFLHLGFYRVLLAAHRGEPLGLGALFSTGRRLPAGLLEHGFFSVGSQVGSLACLIPGVWFFSTYGLATLYVLDRGLGPVNALQASAQATRGQRWGVFRVLFAVLFVNVVGAFACGFGLLVTIPVSMMMLVSLYEQLEPALNHCPLCQESIPANCLRCPGCDEWEPGRSSRVVKCQHCAGRVARHLEMCPLCAEPEPVPPEKVKPGVSLWRIRVPAGAPSGWLTALALVLLLPALAWVDNLTETGQAIVQLVRRLGTFPWWLGVSLFLGVFVVPTLGAWLVAAHAELSVRACDVDQDGVALGRTAAWRGLEIRWSDVSGFRLRRDGVRLQLKSARGIARWRGPLVRTRERETHDLVAHLEERGILNLEG
jgi:hypothetical protein